MIHRALQRLDGEDIVISSVSNLHETAPWGMETQPWFLNAAAIGTTRLDPCELLQRCKEIERALGRMDRERWGPREIDIDLLFYGEAIIDLDDLKVPHPEMHRRAFVLTPLAEIAGNWLHPVLGVSVGELSRGLANGSFYPQQD